jgi:peroxiredoxin
MRELIRHSRLLLALAAAVLPLLAESPRVPRKAPEFVIELPGDRQLLLSQFRGKVVVLEFLFTTCQHCQHASQALTRLYGELGGKGLQPLGVAFNDMAKTAVPGFVVEFGVKYPVGWSSSMAVHDFLGFSILERMVVPQVVLVDRKGMIRFQTGAGTGQADLKGGEAELRAKIEELLKEPAGAGRRPAARKKK